MPASQPMPASQQQECHAPPRALRIATDNLPSACAETGAIVRSVKDLENLLEPAGLPVAAQTVARSQTMQQIVDQAQRYAASSATVLLTGESGTGKELIARLIHTAGPRTHQPYVRVNCAAITESLMDSELFGHERGAFTGAVDSRPGRFEWAKGGTLLLDEISEIPIHVQAKLLRVLEEEEFQRVGGNKTYHASARVIATSNRALDKEIAAGTFRTDLYYRLNVLHLHVPPLRERPEDIAGLAQYFVERFRHEASVPITEVAPETLQLLESLPWPGNVRQLRNVVHRACVLSTSEVLRPSDLPPLESDAPPLPDQFTDMRLEEIERHVIVSNLRKFNGNKTAAARHLGVTSRTITNKIKRYRELGYV